MLDFLIYGSVGYIGLIFRLAMLIHFFRARPEWYWFFVIIFFGPIGAAVYFFVEVFPTIRWKLPAFERMERRKRKAWLETLILDSPSQEALAELALIERKEGRNERAVELFGQALARADDIDCFYGRGLALLELDRPQEAIPDLERAFDIDPTFKFHESSLALAEAYETAGNDARAVQIYEAVLGRTTVSKAYYNYGRLLAKAGDSARAKQMMDEILSKQHGLPRYLKRQERPWVRKAKAFLKLLKHRHATA